MAVTVTVQSPWHCSNSALQPQAASELTPQQRVSGPATRRHTGPCHGPGGHGDGRAGPDSARLRERPGPRDELQSQCSESARRCQLTRRAAKPGTGAGLRRQLDAGHCSRDWLAAGPDPGQCHGASALGHLNRDGWSPLVLAALPGPAAGGCPALGLQRRSLKALSQVPTTSQTESSNL